MTSVRSAAQAAEHSRVFSTLSRVRYVVLGIVHIIIGVIATYVARRGSDGDPGGGMDPVRQTPVSVALLWIIAAGLAALAIWQLAETLVERDPDAKKKWRRRVTLIGTAVVYLTIAGVTLGYALGGRPGSPPSSGAQVATPAGVVMLVLVGLVVGATGVAFIVRGLTRAFEKHLNAPAAAKTGFVTFGVVGYVAKGIAVAVVGVIFVVAAVTIDPTSAGGLDATLQALAASPFGTVIAWIVGAGLILYGLFCVTRSRYATT